MLTSGLRPLRSIKTPEGCIKPIIPSDEVEQYLIIVMKHCCLNPGRPTTLVMVCPLPSNDSRKDQGGARKERVVHDTSTLSLTQRGTDHGPQVKTQQRGGSACSCTHSSRRRLLQLGSPVQVEVFKGHYIFPFGSRWSVLPAPILISAICTAKCSVRYDWIPVHACASLALAAAAHRRKSSLSSDAFISVMGKPRNYRGGKYLGCLQHSFNSSGVSRIFLKVLIQSCEFVSRKEHGNVG